MSLHDEAREVWKRLQVRYKQVEDPLDKVTMDIMAKCMKLIPEHREGGLHPFHRALITGLTPKFKDTIARKASETKAFKAIEASLTATDVETVRAFMRLPKPKGDKFDDQLSCRPKSVQRLCSNYAEILANADKYFELHPGKSPRRHTADSNAPKEPYDWHDRVPGGWKRFAWPDFWRKYPEEAAQLIAGVDLTKDFEECSIADLEAAFAANGVGIEKKSGWRDEARERDRFKRHEDPEALKHGVSQISGFEGTAQDG